MRKAPLFFAAIALAALAPAATFAACETGLQFTDSDVVIGKVETVVPERSADGFVRGETEIATVKVEKTLRGLPQSTVMVRTRKMPSTGAFKENDVLLSFSPGQEVGLVLSRLDMQMSDAYDLTYTSCSAGYYAPAELRRMFWNMKYRDGAIVAAELLGIIVGIVLLTRTKRFTMKTGAKVMFVIGTVAAILLLAYFAFFGGLQWYANNFVRPVAGVDPESSQE